MTTRFITESGGREGPVGATIEECPNCPRDRVQQRIHASATIIDREVRLMYLCQSCGWRWQDRLKTIPRNVLVG